MSSCDFTQKGLAPSQFIPAANVNQTQYSILNYSFSQVHGCLSLKSLSSDQNLWYCSTAAGVNQAGSATSCPVGIEERQCQEPYDLDAGGQKLTVHGCLKDINGDGFYCFSGGSKVKCSPSLVASTSGSSPIPDDSQMQSPSNSTPNTVAITIGSVVGGVVVIAFALFIFFKKRRSVKEKDLSNLLSQPTPEVEKALKGIGSRTDGPPLAEFVSDVMVLGSDEMSGNGLAERVEVHIENGKFEKMVEINHGGVTPRSSISSYTYAPPKHPSTSYDNALPPLSPPLSPKQGLRSPASSALASMTVPSSPLARASSPKLTPDGPLSPALSAMSVATDDLVVDDCTLRPYRTYINYNRSGSPSASRSSSPVSSLPRLRPAPTGSVTASNYIFDSLNFLGKLPLTVTRPLPTDISKPRSLQNPNEPYTLLDLAADWESIYALFYHLAQQSFVLAQNVFDSSTEGVALHKNIFATIARKSKFDYDPRLLSSVNEFASFNDKTESNPNFYAFLSILSEVVIGSLFVPIANPLYVPLYLKSLRKQYKYLPKNERVKEYVHLDQATLFLHLHHSITSLSSLISQTSQSRFHSHVFQLQSYTVKDIESLFSSYNLPVPTHQTIEDVVSETTVIFLRMKTTFPGFSLIRSLPDISVEKQAMTGINLDIDSVLSNSDLSDSQAPVSLFTVWPGLSTDATEVHDKARVWVFVPSDGSTYEASTMSSGNSNELLQE